MRLGMGLGLGNLLSGGPITGMSNKYSFNFDGSNDYLDTGESFESTIKNSFTLSAWVKPTDGRPSAKENFLGTLKYDNYSGYVTFSLETSGKIALVIGTPTAQEMVGTSSVIFPDGATDWTHLAAVFTKASATTATIVLYANGSNVSDTTTKGGSWNIESYVNTYNMFIGGRNQTGTANQFYNGLIDEVSIFNTALSANDITKLASKPLNLSKASSYDTDRTSSLKLWLRAGDKVLPESDASIARSDFYNDFDGTDDYVSVADDSSLALTTALSVSGWVNFASASGSQTIAGHFDYPNNQRSWSLAWLDDTTNYLRFFVSGDGSSFKYNRYAWTPTVGQWYHLTATYNAGTTKLYIDGSAVTVDAESSQPTSLHNSTGALLIGAVGNSSTNADHMEGKLSAVSLYKTTIDAQTIKQFAKSRFTPMRDNRFSVVNFDGSDDYIDCGNDSSLQITGALTISGWFNLSSLSDSGEQILYSKGDQGSNRGVILNLYRLDSSGGIRAGIFLSSSGSSWTTNSTTAHGAISTGNWYHITATYDGGVTAIYLDGSLKDSDSVSGFTINNPSLNARIGDDHSGSREFNGSLSSLSVYNTAKSAEEVYAIYQQGITYDESSLSGLQGYWRMGDDTSKAYPTIADSSSNSNDGTITNGASDDIVQQMVAGYDMGAFENSTEELGVEKITLLSNWTGSDYTSTITASTNTINLEADDSSVNATKYLSGAGGIVTGTTNLSAGLYKVSFDASWDNAPSTKTFTWYSDGSTSTNETIASGSNVFYKKIDTANGNSQFNIQMNNANQGITLANLSIKEVLQSADLSDTYPVSTSSSPVIIDVNEPVLGAELVDNLNGTTAGWDAMTGIDLGTSGDYVTATYESGDNVTGIRFYLGATGTGSALSSNVEVGALYKISMTGYITGTTTAYPLSSDSGVRAEGSSWGQGAENVSTKTFYYKPTNASGNIIYPFYEIGSYTSAGVGYVKDVSVKKVSGNVGIMTNQAPDDLVYSSVLPDQSFLTGVNSAYNFIDLDGGDQYIDCGADVHDFSSGDFTILAWVYHDTSNSDHAGIIGIRNVATEVQFYIREGGGDDNKLGSWNGSGNVFSSSTIADEEWTHVGLVQSGGNKKFYINGALDNTASQGQGTADAASFKIGFSGAGSEYFLGKIGGLGVWSKELSASEISGINTLGRHGNLLDKYSDNLKGYWAMSSLDASTGLSDSISTVYDRSGNSNHGTPTNADAGDLASSPNADPNGYSKGDTNRSTDVK